MSNSIIITYKKWWHRFIPYYRRNIKKLNIIANYDKYEIGQEVMKGMKEMIKYNMVNNNQMIWQKKQ